MIKLIDTHAHILSEKYDDDRDKLLASLSFNMEAFIENASSVKDFDRVIELIDKYSFVYGAVGIHPECVGEWDEGTLSLIESYLSNKKIKAIGEIGLDYYWDKSQMDKQKEILETQVELAKKYNLPVVIHCREAIDDVKEVIGHFDTVKGEVHCFSEDIESARFFLDKGMYLGYGGILTFKKPGYMAETFAYVPSDRFLLETDSPYLAPIPNRGKRNQPDYVYFTAQKMAEIRNTSLDEILVTANNNARMLFNLENNG